LKYVICSEIFRGWTWEATVNFVSGLGYNGIEVAPFTLADSVEKITATERFKLREYAEGKNLEIIGLHWLLVSPEGLSISSPNRQIREKTADYLKSLIIFCSDLGGRYMVLGSPKQRSVEPRSTYRETYDYVCECLLSILPVAGRNNVDILIEPLGKSETNFITSADEAINLIKQINHPNLNLNLDVKAMCDEEKPIAQIIGSSAEYLKHMHVNDPNLLGPGFGNLDYNPIKSSLLNIGYDGCLSVEVFDFSPGAETIAAKSLEYLRNVFGQNTGG